MTQFLIGLAETLVEAALQPSSLCPVLLSLHLFFRCSQEYSTIILLYANVQVKVCFLPLTEELAHNLWDLLGEATCNSSALILPFSQIRQNEPCLKREQIWVISTLHRQVMKECSKAIYFFFHFSFTTSFPVHLYNALILISSGGRGFHQLPGRHYIFYHGSKRPTLK